MIQSSGANPKSHFLCRVCMRQLSYAIPQPELFFFFPTLVWCWIKWKSGAFSSGTKQKENHWEKQPVHFLAGKNGASMLQFHAENIRSSLSVSTICILNIFRSGGIRISHRHVSLQAGGLGGRDALVQLIYQTRGEGKEAWKWTQRATFFQRTHKVAGRILTPLFGKWSFKMLSPAFILVGCATAMWKVYRRAMRPWSVHLFRASEWNLPCGRCEQRLECIHRGKISSKRKKKTFEGDISYSAHSSQSVASVASATPPRVRLWTRGGLMLAHWEGKKWFSESHL